MQGVSLPSVQFQSDIRQDNSASQMTSYGASKISVEPGFMSMFKVQGQVYHLIGLIQLCLATSTPHLSLLMLSKVHKTFTPKFYYSDFARVFCNAAETDFAVYS